GAAPTAGAPHSGRSGPVPPQDRRATPHSTQPCPPRPRRPPAPRQASAELSQRPHTQARIRVLRVTDPAIRNQANLCVSTSCVTTHVAAGVVRGERPCLPRRWLISAENSSPAPPQAP